MLRTMTTLFVFQFLGEIVSFTLQAPIPGPVFGMVFLFLYLLWRDGEAERLRDTAQTLLSHLSLLFVPAGVGVMLYVDTVKKEWLPISVSLLLSTALTIVVTALTVRAVHRHVHPAARYDSAAHEDDPHDSANADEDDADDLSPEERA